MPFAKMCVQYAVGDPLPNAIQAVDFDPMTGEKTNVEVKVTYLNKPLICSACQSLGHLVAASPKTSRKWVLKHPPTVGDAQPSATTAHTPVVDVHPPEVNLNVDKGLGREPNEETKEEGEWTEVTHKRKSASPFVGSPLVESPPMPHTFKNLRNVDEIERKLGKKQQHSTHKRNKGPFRGSPSRS